MTLTPHSGHPRVFHLGNWDFLIIHNLQTKTVSYKFMSTLGDCIIKLVTAVINYVVQ
jgi:hypothetical protein